MKLKQLIMVVAIMFGIATTNGQDKLVIHLVNNSDVAVEINKIQRITFSGNNMLLKPVTGDEQSYHLDNITGITFLDDPSDICEKQNVDKNIEVNVYVNSSGELVVESPHLITGVTVFDLTGRTVKTTRQSLVNVNSLSMGVYLLKVETHQGTVTKKFVKNR